MKRLWYKFVLLLCKPYGWFLNGTGRAIDFDAYVKYSKFIIKCAIETACH